MTTRVLLLIATLVGSVSCGKNSPTGPSAPSFVQIAGLWSYSARLATVAGGECVGPLLQATIGAVEAGTMSVTQSGGTLSARATNSSSGLTCDYNGTAGASSVTLNWTRCDVGIITGATCPNGARRDLEMISRSITATVTGNSASGTSSETWNVFIAGTRTGVGVLTLSGPFNGNRQ